MPQNSFQKNNITISVQSTWFKTNQNLKIYKIRTKVSAALMGFLRPMTALTEAEAMRPAMVSYDVTIDKCILKTVCQRIRPWQPPRGL